MTYDLVTRRDVERMLAAYGARYEGDYFPGSERWRTAWGFEFCLTPEDSGLYDEYVVLQAERLSILPSRP